VNRKLRQILIGLTFAIAGYIIIFGPNGYLDQRAHVREIELLREQNRKLGEQNDKLQQEIGALENDRSYNEKLAREMLGYQSPGEIPLRVEMVGDTAAPAAR